MTDPQRSLAMHERLSWHFYECILFRFAFCYIVLYYTPLAFKIISDTGLSMRWYYALWNNIDGTLGIYLFHLNAAQALPHPTGSGDTALAYIQQALIIVIALIVGVIWTSIDRRTQHYVRLHGWLRVLSRYALAVVLFEYALAKIIPLQFGHLGSHQLAETYGQSSPMDLLWRFMAFSTPYTVFGGCMELLPAILLLFRRTALLGSLIAFAVLLNVVALNFCYDVPVKLYSLNLLSLSIFLILPDIRRLFRIFVLNLPVAPSDLREPFFNSNKVRRGKLILKIAVLALFVGLTAFSAMGRFSMQTSLVPTPSSPLTTRGFHWIQEYPYNQ